MTFSSLFFDRRSELRRLAAAVGLTIALVASALIPAFASAAQITARSISLSDSGPGATAVKYTVTFTASQSAAAFILDFCNDSPDPSDTTCAAPNGFDASGVSADSSSTGFTASKLGSSTSTVEVDGSISAGTNTVILDGITNPTDLSSTAPFYARILTYDTTAHAGAYDVSSTTKTGVLDTGGVSMQIQNKIQVSAAVLESMTFCVTGKVAPTADCANASDPANAPKLSLGQQVGSAFALQPGTPSSGNLYAQLSTNAVSGATVSLKSSTIGCGGLERAGDNACGIGPALAAGVTGNAALFGVTVAGTAADPSDGTGSGTIQAFGKGNSSNYYNDTTAKFNYVAGDLTGVTSPYGDPFLDTNNTTVNNKNITLTFTAAATNSTPAGNYSTNLDMIATGKF